MTQIYHLSNHSSSLKKTITLFSPSYVSPEELQHRKQHPEKYFHYTDDIEAALTILYGDQWKYPTYELELPAQAYCGAELHYCARPAPLYLWESDDYILACDIIDYLDETCQECIAELDKIRYKQGYCPIIDALRDRELHGLYTCDCANWVLQRCGCRCIASRRP